MLWEFGTTSVQLRERKSGFLVPKRHKMKHLDFLSFLLESRPFLTAVHKSVLIVDSIPTAPTKIPMFGFRR